MPDVTSVLLAMYQQIIGGSTAREQAALEAAAASRVIVSGLTIAANGTFSFPGSLVVGGNLTVGSFTVTGPVTVSALTVTGNLTVQGTTDLSGGTGALVSELYRGVANQFIRISGGSGIGAGAGIQVFGESGANANQIFLAATTSTTVTGPLVVTGNPNGAVSTTIRNTANAAAARGQLIIGNDTNPNLCILASQSSGYASAAPNYASGSLLYQEGAGGLTFYCAHASGQIQFWAAAVKRWTMDNTGNFYAGPQGTGNTWASHGPGTSSWGNAGTAALNVLLFNNSNGYVGFVQTSGTATAYLTSSDARLKIDQGRAVNLDALRAVVVHDFVWKADGAHDRGVFAQEAHAVFPRAVSVGADDRTETGALAHPWMTDYSKFVADLIVGWQQHDAELAMLRAMVATLKGQH